MPGHLYCQFHESPCPRRGFHTQLLKAVGQAVVATDLDGVITYWNKAAENHFGWPAAEVLGSKIMDVAPAEPDAAESIQAALRDGKGWSGELFERRHDGSIFPAGVTIRPIFDENNCLVGSVGVSTNIAEQKNALRALELERGRLLTILEHVPARTWVLRGADHVIQMVNRACREVVGDRNVIGRPVREALPELAEQGMIEALDTVYRSGEPLIGRQEPIYFLPAEHDVPERRFVNYVYQPLKDIDDRTDGILVHAVDVTDVVDARLTVERASRSNQLIMDNSLDVICSFDFNGLFTAVSSACERTWGYSPDELLGRNYRDFVFDDDAAAAEEVDHRVRLGDDITHFECRFVRKDGTPVEMLWTATWSAVDQLVFAVGRDISDEKARKKALADKEAKLRQSELRLRSLVAVSSQLLWTADEEGNVYEVGNTWSILYGHHQGRLSISAFADLIHSEDRDRVLAEWEENRAQKMTYELECRLRTADGTYRWFVNRAVPVFDESGVFVEWICACTDISARKAAEAALRQSETHYRTIVDTAREGVWLIDRDARTTFVNARLAEMLGYTPEEIHGRKVFDFVADEDRADIVARIERRRLGMSDGYDIRFRRRDGSYIWTHISATPLYNDRGCVVGSVGMVTDITAWKWYERELIDAKEKAEEMVKLKTAFLTNMSHEIRTPLTGIIGFSEMLLEETEGDVKSMAQLILTSGQRLLLTLNSVMDLAQLESKSLRLNMEELDLVEQVRELLPVFRRRARERGLYLSLQPDLPSIVAKADVGALSRILTNMIDNALKFTNTGGITVHVGSGDGHASVSVADTGIGIGTDFLPRLFQDFKQESEGFSRAYEGVGLGLSITKRLVDLMGGTIDVTSTKGMGTTFTVRLPVDDPAVRRFDSQDKPFAKHSSLPKILVVEDSSEASLLLEMVLGDRYELDLAFNADDALDLASQVLYDLVIMDINLGDGRSGREALRMLRSRPEYMHVPVVACTAYALPGDEESLLEEGFDAYIGKPFRKKLLCETLERLVPKNGAV